MLLNICLEKMMPKAIKITVENLPLIESEWDYAGRDFHILEIIKLGHSAFFVMDIVPIPPLPSQAIYYEEYFYDTFYFTDPAYDRTQFADVRYH